MDEIEKGLANALEGSSGPSKPIMDTSVASRHWRFPRFRMRPEDDDEKQDWWWASTAVPLVAATTGPLANVMSIAALVTSWRNNYSPDHPGVDEYSIGFPDPRWCLALNGASLACGFAGNIFLLFNFTRRVRYIIALPMTIALWYCATGILMGITIAMNRYVPPIHPNQVYSQGFWHAVIAAVLYLISSMTLMLNMLGYFLGHYPQHFELTDEQRNLILQNMMFFIWLAGGGGIFSRVEGWSYPDALYFCDVTVLTVGFGDFHPETNTGRGLVFPYSVGGIIILGLMVGSIARFAKELGASHVVKSHVQKRRIRTVERSAASEREFREMQSRLQGRKSGSGSAGAENPGSRGSNAPLRADMDQHTPKNREGREERSQQTDQHAGSTPLRRNMERVRKVASRQQKLQLLMREKDRFDAMRRIQRSTSRFKQYTALTSSVIAFGILWCIGAIGFWRVEQRTQGLTYFEALYFCYVSLLTIGYGDLAPESNAGKPLFIVWSLIAVPTMTILISDMGDTVIASFKRATFKLGDWTVLPKEGMWRGFLENHPRLLGWFQRWQAERDGKKQQAQVAQGFPTGPEDEDMNRAVPTIQDVASLDSLSDYELGRKLSLAIRRASSHLLCSPPRQYTYEEWVEFTRLIRFTKLDSRPTEKSAEEEELVEWDWIGEESPMMANKTESEWILDRLCESLNRFMRTTHGPFHHHHRD